MAAGAHHVGADATRGETSARAVELSESYQLLCGPESASDEILIKPSPQPADWVPIDSLAVVVPITSRCDMRQSPIDGQWRLHTGIDLGVATGTPIRSSRVGPVAVAAWSAVYGLMVVIDHGEGYLTLYAHN